MGNGCLSVVSGPFRLGYGHLSLFLCIRVRRKQMHLRTNLHLEHSLILLLSDRRQGKGGPVLAAGKAKDGSWVLGIHNSSCHVGNQDGSWHDDCEFGLRDTCSGSMKKGCEFICLQNPPDDNVSKTA